MWKLTWQLLVLRALKSFERSGRFENKRWNLYNKNDRGKGPSKPYEGEGKWPYRRPGQDMPRQPGQADRCNACGGMGHWARKCPPKNAGQVYSAALHGSNDALFKRVVTDANAVPVAAKCAMPIGGGQFVTQGVCIAQIAAEFAASPVANAVSDSTGR